MKNLQQIVLPAILLSIASCTNPGDKKPATPGSGTEYKKLADASWLIGTWENNSAQGSYTETWKMENDSAYQGASYFVIGNDTVSEEKLSLVQRGEALLYIPTVKNQNGGMPVEFTLTSSLNGQLVFENPQHDFPQKITYAKISNDSLVAEISGTKNGKTNAQQFPMKRASR